MKETNLEEVKKVAKQLLYLDPEETDIPSFLVHPFITVRHVPEYMINGKKDDISNNLKTIDVLKDDNIDKVRKYFTDMIDKSNSVWHIYYYMHKPYRPCYFKFISEYLSDEDYNEMLCSSWTDTENPNQDPNVSIKQWIKYFKMANKNLIMCDNELEYYNNLPKDKPITIYRGVGKGREPYGLSWTDDKSVAEWFAKRWKNTDAYMFIGEAYKKDIFAYFNGRNEHELVTNVNKVKIIERVDLYG